MCALLEILRKIPINAPGGGDVALGDYSKPTYSVSVTNEEAQAARSKYLDEKEESKYRSVNKAL